MSHPLSTGIAALLRALPLTEDGQRKLVNDLGAIEALITECIDDGSLSDHPVTRAICLSAGLAGYGWPPYFATALALADHGTPAQHALIPLGTPPEISMPTHNPSA